MRKIKYNSFEEMPVWDKAMNLAIEIFHLTEKLPKKVDFGLTSQIRRFSIYGNKVGYFKDPKIQENMRLIEDIWKELNSLMPP